jgi:uncharacterized membrane protein
MLIPSLASGRGLTCRSVCAILLIVTIVDMIWGTVLSTAVNYAGCF